MKRREFLQNTLAASGALWLPNAFEPLLGLAKKHKFKLGYASITWGGNFEQALKEISGLGFKAVQISGATHNAFKDKADQLVALVKQSGLQVPISSGGNLRIEPEHKQAAWDGTLAVSRTHQKLPGAELLQLTNGSQPKGRKPTVEELKSLAQQMNELGKKIKEELGLRAVYHNHMWQLGETPEEVDTILQACDPRYVGFLLDIAHYYWGGGNPAEAIVKYKDILQVMHLKDVGTVPGGTEKDLQFVELGQGKLDLKGVFEAIDRTKFKGWAIIEIDSVPKGSGRTPLQCAEICKKYLVENQKMKIG